MAIEHAFLPVLLGDEMNAYGMARAFYESYGVKPLALNHTNMEKIQQSDLLTFREVPRLHIEERFVVALKAIAEEFTDKKLLLLACDEFYVKKIVKHKEELSSFYVIPYVDESLANQLLTRESMYQLCAAYGFHYPAMHVCTVNDYEQLTMPFEYPIVIKPMNMTKYASCIFPGKKKVYTAHNEDEKDAIFHAIYKESAYRDDLMVQQYIPGEDANMRVVNAYVGQDHKVKLLSVGNPILEEHSPDGIGRYVAIMTTYNKELMDCVKTFLEALPFQGFATFDMKYDERDGLYKLLSMELHNELSNYYVTASGYNLMQYVADDFIRGSKQQLTYVQNKHLWTIVPNGVLFKYVLNEQLVIEAKSLIRQGLATDSIFNYKDMNAKRWLNVTLDNLSFYRKYKKYFNNKGLSNS
ncbi:MULTISPECIES: carboxylate--amine ligase [unclassified Lysinibacillus]|uniref:carboxylate--amine ligase n=1 Tax=unclassified Lysinibacillus TaxID=2636778 RepID=UPI00116BD15F|nr:ATP-grasp domain-containing protein [Lysinibacillus sp. CD3-6]QPQ34247.1 ATP-grasp domain-containing protein [Lysinibacillus sp. JNUCC-52]UED79798.1 ATP-grasp domain-containing protein [Lysinibacillus sp. CD3-6]